MAVICPRCGREYDIALFQFGRTIACDCGAVIDESHIELFRVLDLLVDGAEDARKAEELRRMADGVCRMILDEEVPEIDIDIAIERARERCRESFPDKVGLFEMVYGSRFRRLREQFRKKE